MLDLHHNIEVRRVLSPVSVSDDTPQVGEIIDTQGYHSLEFLIATGSIADANATFVVLVQDSNLPAMGDAASVADSQLLGLEATASFQYDDDNETRKIGYLGVKRYVRLTITPSGNGSAALLSAVAVLGTPAVAPVA